MKRHKEKIHGTELFECNHCKKSFNDELVLYQHQSKCLEENKSHECNLCGKKFKAKHVLHQHMQRNMFISILLQL